MLVINKTTIVRLFILFITKNLINNYSTNPKRLNISVFNTILRVLYFVVSKELFNVKVHLVIVYEKLFIVEQLCNKKR